MSLLLAEGEQMIRRYKCTCVDYRSSNGKIDLKGPKGKKPETDGLVVVTNKRVVYYAESAVPTKGNVDTTMHLQEAFIDKISSTEFMQADGKRCLLLQTIIAIIGIALLGYGIINGFTTGWNDIMALTVPLIAAGAVVFVIGLILIMMQFSGVYSLVIMRINTLSNDVGIRVSGVSETDERDISFYMVPTPEFKIMASEIGALIIDVQTMGDACLTKWIQQ